MILKKIASNNAFIINITIIILLFATPFMVSTEMYNGTIVAKEFWLLWIVVLILLVFSIKLFVGRSPLSFSLNITDVFLLIFYLYYLSRAYFTNYTPLLYNHKVQMLSGCLVAYIFVKSAILQDIKNTKRTEIIHSILFIIILFGLLQAIYGLLQLYGYYPSNHGIYKITGSFFNPAPYALYLAMVFTMALASYTFVEIPPIESYPNTTFSSISSFLQTKYFLLSTLKYTALATMFAIVVILPATMIRASWVGAIVGSVIVLWFALKQGKWQLPRQLLRFWNVKRNQIILIVFGIILIGSCSLFLFKIKEGSSIGKSFIWEVTIGKIAEQPFWGHGVGRFEAEYNNWQVEYFSSHQDEMKSAKGLVAGNTKYCFNEFLELASEIGLVGILLFLTFLSLVLFYSLKSKDPINAILTPTFAALLIIATISYPFYNIPLQLLFFVIVAILSANSNAVKIVKLPNSLRYIGVIASGILTLFIVMHLYNKQIAYKNWLEAHYVYSSGNFTEANIMYNANMNTLQYEGLFLQDYGKSLQMSNDSNAIKVLTQATNRTSDYVLYCTLGDAYKNQKHYKYAENAYQTAAKMVPHKLYPNYLLAKLYITCNNTKMAIEKANEVLKMSAKTESLAEREIKAEMNSIIEKREILHAD